MEANIKTLVIKKDYEFRRVYKKGQAYVNPALIVYVLKNNKKINRIGITTSHKIGNAVQRNRDRRIIREAYRQLEDKISVGYDIVFVARGRTSSLKMQDVLRVMTSAFRNAKLLNVENK